MPEEAPHEPASPAGWAGRPWFFALALLGLLGLIAGVVVYGTKPRLYVDPAVEGDVGRYRETISVAKPAPAKKEDFLDSLTVTRTNNRVRVEFPHNSRNESSRLLDYRLYRAKAGESIQLPKGPFGLALQSIGYGEFPPEKLNEYAASVESRHFDPATGEEFDEEAAKQRLPRHERDIRYRGVFPTVKFLFTHDPEEELKVIGYSLFDARTKASLSSGYSRGGSGGRRLRGDGGEEVACRTGGTRRRSGDLARRAHRDPAGRGGSHSSTILGVASGRRG